MGCWCAEHNYRGYCVLSLSASCMKEGVSVAAPEIQQGDTVLIIDQTSNDCGKVGNVSIIRHSPDGIVSFAKPYGVTFGDNVLRYFSREGLSLQVADCPGPDYTITDPVPPEPVTFTLETYGPYMDAEAQLTVRGPVAVLLALAAELVKRG